MSFFCVEAVLASSFAAEQNTKQLEEDACELGMDNQQSTPDKNTSTETDGCMEEMKTNVID